jgi:hypothetical protein
MRVVVDNHLCEQPSLLLRLQNACIEISLGSPVGILETAKLAINDLLTKSAEVRRSLGFLASRARPGKCHPILQSLPMPGARPSTASRQQCGERVLDVTIPPRCRFEVLSPIRLESAHPSGIGCWHAVPRIVISEPART